jgi:hypothetical protein
MVKKYVLYENVSKRCEFGDSGMYILYVKELSPNQPCYVPQVSKVVHTMVPKP